MDYRTHLLRPLSRHFVDILVQEIFVNPSDAVLIYRLIFDADVTVAWRAAWAYQKISEKHPDWFNATQFMEIASLTITSAHGGLQRGCLSVLNNLPVPESISVDFINACFDWMVSPKSPIAVQALSMKMLYRICLIEPGFTPELIAYLENVDISDYSPGFKSTRKKVLNALTKK